MTYSKEAIDNYMVWELCKKNNIQKKIIEGLSKEELKPTVEKARQEYREKDFNRTEKIEKIRELDNNPEYRIKIFKECSWKKETVETSDLGTTLPRIGDLPPEAITGSLRNTADFVREADPEKYRDVKYIKALKKYPDLLDEFPPWVVTPGKRPYKLERMNKVHGKKDWKIKDTWGMVNDGNHRTIAKILAGNPEKIECYVGYRKD